MADLKSSTPFKALVAQTTAVLLTRGLEIEPVAVRDVVSYVVNTAAKNVGVDAHEAVHLVSPEIVADAIEAAADDSREDAAAVHAVRPVRVDVRTVEVPAMALGRLVMAGAQAGKYASANGDGRAAAHAMDLVTELGSATVSASGGDLVDVPVGVLDELADLVERVAGRVDTGQWSICPCGVPHEQADVDRQVVVAMSQDAAIARDLWFKADQAAQCSATVEILHADRLSTGSGR